MIPFEICKVCLRCQYQDKGKWRIFRWKVPAGFQLSENEFNKLHLLGVSKKLLQTFSEFDNSMIKVAWLKCGNVTLCGLQNAVTMGYPLASFLYIHNIPVVINCLDNVRESIKNYNIPRA